MTDTNALSDKVIEVINKLEAAGDTLAPKVYDEAMLGIRMNGYFGLASGVLLLALGGLLAWMTMRCIRIARDEESSYGADDFFSSMGAIFGGIGCVACLAFAGANLLDASNWMEAFSPQTYLIMHTLKL